jgi:hypothetical protein
VVGTIHNKGNGAPTRYHPAATSTFGHQPLADFVADSRTAKGQPMTEEYLLDELITEYEHGREIAEAARAGRSALRLMAPLGEGEHLDGEYYAAQHTTAAKVATPAHRAALVRQLQQHAPAGPGEWWQLCYADERIMPRLTLKPFLCNRYTARDAA